MKESLSQQRRQETKPKKEKKKEKGGVQDKINQRMETDQNQWEVKKKKRKSTLKERAEFCV